MNFWTKPIEQQLTLWERLKLCWTAWRYPKFTQTALRHYKEKLNA